MSGAFQPVNPKPFLQGLVGKDILVKLKWGQEYQGELVSVDSYMNIQLIGTKEFVDGKHAGDLGEVLIRSQFLFSALTRRCNNVLWVSASSDDVEMKD
ncbi:Small nuclear ribonucleoprotein F [Neolecta irregularis DAH-3]|uniref:Sm protein F n=1 Tax=Neolecta irregularis (strain DAH-3) TaxID=1198029 RepID=A0A1U7LWT3_NEOID|nr:Small nuclear ribonucleoprotein F [Neolecta irregularis DAH-3]|eukprot:OLL27078.1 Small nuclear ribonucleoprotein F [Neolecta irregularis DAH-3]